MHTPRITRRQFLKGCSAAAATAAVGPRLIFAPEAHAQSSGPSEAVVMLFLRGGMDGLNFVVPIARTTRPRGRACR